MKFKKKMFEPSKHQLIPPDTGSVPIDQQQTTVSLLGSTATINGELTEKSNDDEEVGSPPCAQSNSPIRPRPNASTTLLSTFPEDVVQNENWMRSKQRQKMGDHLISSGAQNTNELKKIMSFSAEILRKIDRLFPVDKYFWPFVIALLVNVFFSCCCLNEIGHQKTLVREKEIHFTDCVQWRSHCINQEQRAQDLYDTNGKDLRTCYDKQQKLTALLEEKNLEIYNLKEISYRTDAKLEREVENCLNDKSQIQNRVNSDIKEIKTLLTEKENIIEELSKASIQSKLYADRMVEDQQNEIHELRIRAESVPFFGLFDKYIFCLFLMYMFCCLTNALITRCKKYANIAR